MIEVSMDGRLIKVTMETTEAVELVTVIADAFAWHIEGGGLRARLANALRRVASLYPRKDRGDGMEVE